MPEENGEQEDPPLSPSTLMRRSSTAGRDAFHTATIKGGADSTANGKGMDNYVATTKYSMLTFLPKALYEQVRVFESCLWLHPPSTPPPPICAQQRSSGERTS